MFETPTSDEASKIISDLVPSLWLPIHMQVRARRAYTPPDGDANENPYRADTGASPIPLFVLFR